MTIQEVEQPVEHPEPDDVDSEPADITLSVDIIVAGLELEEVTLTREIRSDADQITRLQGLNSERRARLRQVKRMLTAAKPTRSRAKKAAK